MTAPKPNTRVRMPRAEREVQMLEVAERVFSERGFHAATMDEIAEQVGVTKPLIYDYFGSKEGLLVATVERARHQLIGALLMSWSDHTQAPVRDRVKGLFESFYQFVDEHAQAFALLRTEGALIGEAAASVERIRQLTAKALAEGLGTLPMFANVPHEQVVLMSEVIVGGVERLAVYRSEHPGMSPRDSAELIMLTTWDGLANLAAS